MGTQLDQNTFSETFKGVCLEELLGELEESYGSLEEPNWSFAAKRLKTDPYGALKARLSESYELNDSTDLNTDVSVCLGLENSEINCALRLSLITRVAAISDGIKGYLLEESTVIRQPSYVDLVRVLDQFGIGFIGRSELGKTLRFGGVNRTLYEVLISSDYALEIEEVASP